MSGRIPKWLGGGGLPSSVFAGSLDPFDHDDDGDVLLKHTLAYKVLARVSDPIDGIRYLHNVNKNANGSGKTHLQQGGASVLLFQTPLF